MSYGGYNNNNRGNFNGGGGGRGRGNFNGGGNNNNNKQPPTDFPTGVCTQCGAVPIPKARQGGNGFYWTCSSGQFHGVLGEASWTAFQNHSNNKLGSNVQQTVPPQQMQGMQQNQPFVQVPQQPVPYNNNNNQQFQSAPAGFQQQQQQPTQHAAQTEDSSSNNSNNNSGEPTISMEEFLERIGALETTVKEQSSKIDQILIFHGLKSNPNENKRKKVNTGTTAPITPAVTEDSKSD